MWAAESCVDWFFTDTPKEAISSSLFNLGYGEKAPCIQYGVLTAVKYSVWVLYCDN